jgi:hypothetical protein
MYSCVIGCHSYSYTKHKAMSDFKIQKNTDAPVHAVKAYGGGGAAVHLHWTLEGSGQHQTPAALTLGRTVLTESEVGWTPQSVCTYTR